MRMAAVSQGVVVSANVLGKAKTVAQVAMVFALIVVGDGPAWVQVLVYATVAITVFSGVDYFFGIRGKLREHERRSRRIDA
jgi:CDP-diacylglycerol---glycerol-3-phosphate 3-phosphatidyltransferase